MGKQLLLSILLILSAMPCAAQQTVLWGLDTSKFPVITAKIVATDATGASIRPDASMIHLTEDLVDLPITSVSCPPTQQATPVSVAMSIDCSGSMANPTPPSIRLARISAQRFVESLVMPPSDAAVQTCTNIATIGVDFTTKRDRIIDAISKVRAGGGNDFAEQLLNPSTGLLNIAKTGKNKRIAVLFTDAYWDAFPPATLQQCVDTCSKYSITFMAIVFSNSGVKPDGIVYSLRKLAEATNGSITEGELTELQALALADALSSVSQGLLPCEITWSSTSSCLRFLNRSVAIAVDGGGAEARQTYQVVNSNNATLTCTPLSVIFKNAVVGTAATSTVSVKATGAPMKVRSIRSNDARFTVTPQSFHLEPGASQDVVVSYMPTDSTYVSTQLVVDGLPCGTTMYATAISDSKPPATRSLEIVEPNGGEQYAVGIDTVVRWKGIAPTEPVKLDYSTNSGSTWLPVASSATGLTFAWKNVPNTPSTTCLLRAQQVATPAASTEDTTMLFLPRVTAMHPSAELHIGYEHGYVILHSNRDMSLVGSMRVHTDSVTAICGSTNRVVGRRVSASSDWTIASFNVSKRTILGKTHTPTVYRAVVFGPTDSTVFAGGDDGVLREYHYPSMSYMRDVITLPSPITSMMSNNRESLIAIGTASGNVTLFDAIAGTVVWQEPLHTAAVRSVSWQRSDSLLATAGDDGAVHAIRPYTRAVAYSIPAFNKPVSGVDWYDDTTNRYIAVAVRDDSMYIYELPSMRRVGTKFFKEGPQYVVYTSDGVATSYGSQFGLCAINGGYNRSTTNLFGTLLNLVWSADGTTLAVAGTSLAWVYSLQSKKWARMTEPRHESPHMIAYSRNGTYLVHGMGSSTQLMDLTIGDSTVRDLSSFPNEMIKMHPQNDSIIGSTAPTWVMRENVVSGTVSKAINTIGAPVDFAWSGDGSVMAIFADDGTITIYDCLGEKELRTFPAGFGAVRYAKKIDITSDGTKVVVAADTSLYVHDVATGGLITWTDDAKKSVASVDWNADGSMIVTSGGYTGTVLATVWDARTMRPTNVIATPFPGYTQSDCAVFSPVEDVIAVSTRYASVLFYRVGKSAAPIQIDTSDALWSIVRPQLKTRDVDMRTVRIGEKRDSLVLDLATCSSVIGGQADTIWIEGANASDFDVHYATLPMPITMARSLQAEFTFTPRATGPRTATCVIVSHADTLRCILTGNGVTPSLALETAIIDLGAHVIGTPFDSVVAAVRNIATTPVNIIAACIVGPDSVQLSLGGVLCSSGSVLAPTSTLPIALRFTPRFIGRTSTLVQFNTTEATEPLRALVVATGIGPSVAVRSDSGMPGDKRPLTLVMRGMRGGAGGGTPLRYRASVSYDASMLVTSSSTVSRTGLAATSFTGTWNGADSIVGTVPATLTLGRADSTVVALTDFTWLDDMGNPLDLDVLLEPGVYKLLGLCREKGTRFFDPEARITAATVYQRNDAAGVDITSTHGGSIDCTVHTMDGRLVASHPLLFAEGTTHFDVSLAALPHGVYLARLGGTNATAMIVR
ncbi:MAG: choice-of-anchor D domain-containing protein [Bacteroidetes bacterium]|nr:choice-of-anchor D domain-containing protein [Bacteroidota bacterium]